MHLKYARRAGWVVSNWNNNSIKFTLHFTAATQISYQLRSLHYVVWQSSLQVCASTRCAGAVFATLVLLNTFEDGSSPLMKATAFCKANIFYARHEIISFLSYISNISYNIILTYKNICLHNKTNVYFAKRYSVISICTYFT